MKTYSGYITELEKNQVFCFGSNLQGFHGAGAAGFASFGIGGNKWRNFDYSSKPNGWKGKWNVKGIGEGLQEGTEGKSYALPTVEIANGISSLTKNQIIENIKKLYICAKENPSFEFLIAYRDDGAPLINGYEIKDMAKMFSCENIPENIVFENNFQKLITECLKNERK